MKFRKIKRPKIAAKKPSSRKPIPTVRRKAAVCPFCHQNVCAATGHTVVRTTVRDGVRTRYIRCRKSGKTFNLVDL